MPAQSRDELVKLAKDKWQREQLVEKARQKWASENAAPTESFDLGQRTAQGLRSAVEGATFGLSEPVISGLMAVEQNVKKSAQEASSIPEFFQKAVDPSRVKSEYEADVERRRLFEKENPMTATGSELTGALASTYLTGGTSALAKGLNVVPKTLQAGGKAIEAGVKALPGAAKILASEGVLGSAARIGQSALSSGAQALGGEALRRQIQEPTGFIKPEDKLPSLGETAAFGAKFGGAIASIPEIASQSARFGKFAARVLTGVRGENIDYYLANQKRIQEAPSLEQIKTQIDDTIIKLNDDVDEAKLSVDQAKSLLKDNQNKLDDAIRMNKNISAQQKADLRLSLKQAQRDFDLAWKAKASEIKNARVPIQPDDVLDSVEAVKQQVSDLSEKSYKVLDDFKGKFDISDLSKQIASLQNGLKVDGKLMSKDSEAAFNVLERWKQNLQGKGFVKGPTVKAIIQEVDSDLRLAGDRMAGEYSDKTYNALMGMRQILDNKIKDPKYGVPFYKEIMQDVAALNILRGELSKTFGRREGVVSKLARIDNPNLKHEQELLFQLGKLTGKDFETPVLDFAKLRAQGRTPIAQETAKQALPEFKTLATAARAEGATRSPDFGAARAAFIADKGPEAQAVKSAQKLLEDNLKILQEAQGRKEPFKGLTTANTENFIKQLMGNPRNGIEKRKLAAALGEMSETDFTTMVNDLRVRESFEKEITQGSRNVNLWRGLIGGLVGFLTGGVSEGILAAGAGAGYGAIMDKYGPQMTRKVLDGMLKIKANPTMQDIESTFYNIPPELKDRLKTDFSRISTMYNNASAIDRRMTDLDQKR